MLQLCKILQVLTPQMRQINSFLEKKDGVNMSFLMGGMYKRCPI